ncbi:hypothetical protein Ciccas_007014 [Cichlidogyrus casuarinus]|uniref:KIF-binding protein n=1 Tax=Cichlidogyrus casuarinus TaxID=1844966 RepID=A0ABD2Q435_9PLAT
MNKYIESCQKLSQEKSDLINLLVDINNEQPFNDPQDNPFQSKYAARDFIKTLLHSLNNSSIQANHHENVNSLSFCFFKLFLACNHLETEEKHETRRIIEELREDLDQDSDIRQIKSYCENGELSAANVISAVGVDTVSTFSGILLYLFCLMGMATSGYELDKDDRATRVKDPVFWFEAASRTLDLHDCMKATDPKAHFILWETFFLPENLNQIKTLGKSLELETACEELKRKLVKMDGSSYKAPFFFFQLETLDCLKWSSNCAALANYYSATQRFFDSAECLLCAKKFALQTSIHLIGSLVDLKETETTKLF